MACAGANRILLAVCILATAPNVTIGCGKTSSNLYQPPDLGAEDHGQSSEVFEDAGLDTGSNPDLVGDQGSSCELQVTLRGGETLDPSVVRVYLGIRTCEGKAVVGLTASDFIARENGTSVSPFESGLAILPTTEAFALSTLRLLDMSGSIVQSGNLAALQQAARDFVNGLAGNGEIAIYAFDGRQEPIMISDFSESTSELLARIDSISDFQPADNSTNLNGAVLKGLELLDARRSNSPRLFAAALAVFTDGSDQAGYSTDEAAAAAAQSSRYSVYTIGVGQELDQDQLRAIGKDGAVFATDMSQVSTAFNQIAEAIKDMSLGLYVVAYCSPARSGSRILELTVQGVSTLFCFKAEGFSGGCDPSNFLGQTSMSPDACPMGSGWPCTCTGQSCSDGSACLYPTENGVIVTTQGVCRPTCTVDADCPCQNFGLTACSGTNVSTGESTCSVRCSSDLQCPDGQACHPTYKSCKPIR